MDIQAWTRGTQIGGRRKPDVGSVHGSLYSVGRITLSSDDEPLGPQKVGSSLTNILTLSTI